MKLLIPIMEEQFVHILFDNDYLIQGVVYISFWFTKITYKL